MWHVRQSVRWYRLTSNEIAAGLKPLIVKIHPDLYANYPDIQEVNSRSLSNLHSWLDQLNDRLPNLPKLAVSFYLKGKDGEKTRSVSVLLEPSEVRAALASLFGQMELRRTHLEYVISKADDRRNPSHVEFDEDVLYHSIFRQKTRVRSLNPDETLAEWLGENLAKGRSEQEKWRLLRKSVIGRMEEIEQLLKCELTWCSVYGLPIQSGIIRSFYVIVKSNLEQLGHLEGTKLLFCDLQHTTLAADRGAKHTICLSVIDQAEDWRKFFVRYRETELLTLIKRTDYKEEELRRLLGNIQIVRPAALGAVGGATVGRPVEILLYEERIAILLHHLYMYNKPLDMDLSAFKIEIDIAQFETGYIHHEHMNERHKPEYLSISESGSFLVRYDIEPSELLSQILAQIDEVKERKDLVRHLERRERYLRQKLVDEYKLESIDRGYGLPVSKMVDSCHRLLRSGVLDAVNVAGCKILISKDYKRHFDGFLVLKWDWK